MNDRNVSLSGRFYEVDPLLVGQTVTLRYDPSVAPSRPLQVRHNGADEASPPFWMPTPTPPSSARPSWPSRPSWRIESDTGFRARALISIEELVEMVQVTPDHRSAVSRHLDRFRAADRC